MYNEYWCEKCDRNAIKFILWLFDGIVFISSILLNLNIAIFINMIELLLNCALSALLFISHIREIHINLCFGLCLNVFIGNIEHELWIFVIFSLDFCRAICFYTSSNLLFIKYLIEMMKFYLEWFFHIECVECKLYFPLISCLLMISSLSND